MYYLKKEEVLRELNKRGIATDATEKLDALRKQLMEIIRVASQELSDQGKEQSGNSENNSISRESNQIRINESEATSDEEIMSEHTSKIEFKLNKDDWEAFNERLEIYFTVKKITEAADKAAILLTRIDEDAYKLLINLCAPGKPATINYEELVKTMANHLNPKPSEVMER